MVHEKPVYPRLGKALWPLDESPHLFNIHILKTCRNSGYPIKHSAFYLSASQSLPSLLVLLHPICHEPPTFYNSSKLKSPTSVL